MPEGLARRIKLIYPRYLLDHYPRVMYGGPRYNFVRKTHSCRTENLIIFCTPQDSRPGFMLAYAEISLHIVYVNVTHDFV